MQHSDILALAGLRVDGRRPNEVRTIQHRFGVTSNCDGSVYMEQGLNKVLVAVCGPHEPAKRDNSAEKGIISCQFVNAPFSGTERKKRRMGDRRSVEMSNHVKKTFESVIEMDQYPRSEIQIIVHVTESDGSLICTIMNAVSMALMSAGIMMTDMIAACSVGYLKQQACQDVTQVEESSGAACMPVAIKTRSKDIAFCLLDSRISLNLLESTLECAVEGCSTISVQMEAGIRNHMSTA